MAVVRYCYSRIPGAGIQPEFAEDDMWAFTGAFYDRCPSGTVAGSRPSDDTIGNFIEGTIFPAVMAAATSAITGSAWVGAVAGKATRGLYIPYSATGAAPRRTVLPATLRSAINGRRLGLYGQRLGLGRIIPGLRWL